MPFKRPDIYVKMSFSKPDILIIQSALLTLHSLLTQLTASRSEPFPSHTDGKKSFPCRVHGGTCFRSVMWALSVPLQLLKAKEVSKSTDNFLKAYMLEEFPTS